MREDCSMTQVDLANALGIAPASVYRYESGTSTPNADVLYRLSRFAMERDVRYAHDFHQALSQRTQGLAPFAYDEELLERQNVVDRATAALRADQQLIVLALVKMLRENEDKTAERVLNLVLEPWIAQAKAEMDADREKKKATGPRPSKSHK
ncbi:MAG: helix-turn-helix transcriptional regulator [Bryobacteraceae bacterium]